jgi:hypothetical protein
VGWELGWAARKKEKRKRQAGLGWKEGMGEGWSDSFFQFLFFYFLFKL